MKKILLPIVRRISAIDPRYLPTKVIWGGIVAAVFVLFIGTGGIFELLTLNRKERILRQRIETLKHEKTVLEQRLDSLRQGKAHYEVLARREMGFVGKDEQLYEIHAATK